MLTLKFPKFLNSKLLVWIMLFGFFPGKFDCKELTIIINKLVNRLSEKASLKKIIQWRKAFDKYCNNFRLGLVLQKDLYSVSSYMQRRYYEFSLNISFISRYNQKGLFNSNLSLVVRWWLSTLPISQWVANYLPTTVRIIYTFILKKDYQYVFCLSLKRYILEKLFL